MMFKGEEKNKTIFDAYLVLAKARLFQNKPLEALTHLIQFKKFIKKTKHFLSSQSLRSLHLRKNEGLLSRR